MPAISPMGSSVRLSLAILSLQAGLACQTSNHGDAAPETSPSEVSSVESAPVDDSDEGKHYALGPLTDDDIRQAVYQGLADFLSKKQSLGGGESESTDIGDYDSFKFSVVKLSKGPDEVSGDIHAVPDGMDVQVTGWFKRTVTTPGEDTKPACTSFDAVVTMKKTAGDWHMRNDTPPNFGREDSEDCF